MSQSSLQPHAAREPEVMASREMLLLTWKLRQNARETFKRLDLRLVDAVVLDLLARGLTRPKPIVKQLGVHFSTVSGILRSFEVQGWVVRGATADKRHVEVNLTEAGVRAHGEVLEVWLEAVGVLPVPDADLALHEHLQQYNRTLNIPQR